MHSLADKLAASLKHHRVQAHSRANVLDGQVRFSLLKYLWLVGMLGTAVVGGLMTFSWLSLMLFLSATGAVLLLGHSLGSHRKLIHNSFQCPKWLEYALVYCGVQVGLAGPIGLLRQHELRDYAQRLPDCHAYLRHGSTFWRDAWWQLCCDLKLSHPPQIHIEPSIARDRFYQFLERTWMAQQLPLALLFYAWGGWGFVFWGVCARISAGVVGHWLIGYFAHNQGHKHFEVQGAAVQGHNVRFTSLLTMGESWHNNHHAYPGSARLGLLPGQWDPGWWALMVFHKMGLAWNFRLPAAMPARAELLALDEGAAACMAHANPARASEALVLGPKQVLSFCWRRHPGGADSMRLIGPTAHLRAKLMQSIAGPNTRFEVDLAAPRLLLMHNQRLIKGLPALCACLCRRQGAVRWLGLLAAPAAIAIESVRGQLSLR